MSVFVANDTEWSNLHSGRGRWQVRLFEAVREVEPEFVERQEFVGNGYGELSQGDTEQVWVIFKVDGKYYKKFGTADSYGEITWNGDCTEVEKKIKTIEVFE